MDIGRTTTTTEAQRLIYIAYYYRYMCPSQYHILYPLIYVSVLHKGRKVPCNDAI